MKKIFSKYAKKKFDNDKKLLVVIFSAPKM